MACHQHPVMTVSNLCCCFSLKTAAVITGVLASILSLASIAEDIVSMINYRKPEEEDPENVVAMIQGQLSLTIITFNMVLVELVFSILLVYGCYKDKPRYIKPWIYYTIVCLFTVDVALLIYMFLSFFYVGVIAGFAVLVPTIVATLVGAYLIIQVNSYYRLLMGVDEPVIPTTVP